MTWTDDDIAICREAIVRIAKIGSVEERRQALTQYWEPHLGAIQRALAHIFAARRERRLGRMRSALQGGDNQSTDAGHQQR